LLIALPKAVFKALLEESSKYGSSSLSNHSALLLTNAKFRIDD